MKTFILTFLLFGQDLTFKPEYVAKPNEYVVVSPESGSGIVKYVPLSDGLNVLDSKLLKNPSSLVVIGKSGKYKVLAYTAVNNTPSDPIFFHIVIGDQPKPNNELEQIINSVYGADSTANKVQYKDKMLTGFRAVLEDIGNMSTVGELNVAIREKVSAKLAAGEGGALRSVLKDELSNQFGIDGEKVLDRELAKRVVSNIVVILGRL
jgi:hypothetical protein